MNKVRFRRRSQILLALLYPMEYIQGMLEIR